MFLIALVFIQLRRIADWLSKSIICFNKTSKCRFSFKCYRLVNEFTDFDFCTKSDL